MNRLRLAALAAVMGLGVACGCSGMGTSPGNGTLMSRIRGHRDCPEGICEPGCPTCGDGPVIDEGGPFPGPPVQAGPPLQTGPTPAPLPGLPVPATPDPSTFAPPPGAVTPAPMPRISPVPEASPTPAPPGGLGASRRK
jgi:hypothetical protein